MTSKKLGALLRSVPAATAAGAAPEPAVAPAPEPPPAPPAPPAETEVPLQVLIPTHVRKQLALKAAEEGRSLRALVLLGIRSLGITVTDADIRGKRGRR